MPVTVPECPPVAGAGVGVGVVAGALDALCVAGSVELVCGVAFFVATTDFVGVAFVAAGVCACCVAAGVVCVAPPICNPPESESAL